jgi:hypothetical protein
MKGEIKELVIDGDGRDLFVIADGVKIAKRGRPGTPQAKTWVPLEPRWSVLDCTDDGTDYLEVVYDGVRVH